MTIAKYSSPKRVTPNFPSLRLLASTSYMFHNEMTFNTHLLATTISMSLISSKVGDFEQIQPKKECL